MANRELGDARRQKQDEFYTQFHDIEKEMNTYREFDKNVFRDKTVLLPCDDPEWSNFTKYFAQNFEVLGLKELVSTSYAPSSLITQPTLFEEQSPHFDAAKTKSRGKIFRLARDTSGDHRIDLNDLQWEYLEGDGDFRSEEICRLRDAADFIITNPPFSLFREFLAWIVEAEKQFVIIGNINAITNKETFPLVMSNRVWLGPTIHSGDREFQVPPSYPLEAANSRVDEHGNRYVRVKNIRWYTNVDHGRRHEPLKLMTAADNLRFSRHKELRGQPNYRTYDNYDAIEVPFSDAIPSDFDGVMGVPVTFLDKYAPEQFEIVGMSANGAVPDSMKLPHFKKHNEPFIDGVKIYQRLFIQHRRAPRT